MQPTHFSRSGVWFVSQDDHTGFPFSAHTSWTSKFSLASLKWLTFVVVVVVVAPNIRT